MNIEDIMPGFHEKFRQRAIQHTMTLGQLIDELSTVDSDLPMRFCFGDLVPHTVLSWRGSYDHLAIGYAERTEPKVCEFLPQLTRALTSTFEGYKGGVYIMHRGTPVWVANWGSSGNNTAITSIKASKHEVVIHTKQVEF